MLIAYVPLFVAFVGLLIWALASAKPGANPVTSEAGRIAYFVGLFWTVAPLVGKTVVLFK